MDSSQNIISLKEYVEVRLEEHEKALSLASHSLEKRLESMNAFREQINRMEGTLVTKKELDLTLERIDKDKRADISLIISFFAIGIGIVGILINIFK